MTQTNLGSPAVNFDPSKVIPVIEEGLKVERLSLEANDILDTPQYYEIQERIQETQILLSVLRMASLP